jgi:ATP synthase protein I
MVRAVHNPPYIGPTLRSGKPFYMSLNGKDLGPGRGEISTEDRAALKRRASDIGQRLEHVRARSAPPRDGPARQSALGQGFKIAVELVVGVVVGAFIGWVLDRQLGTGPWLLIVFLVFGFCAGMLNVFRTARRMQADAEPLQRGALPAKGEDENNR